MSKDESIKLLADNVSSFFNTFEKKYTNSMKCKAGCSACCYTDLSVFSVEESRISNWFKELPSLDRADLKNLWTQPVDIGACEFLYDNQCSIYEARPIICRSHGALIKFKDMTKDQYDICPLNETPETLNAKSDALDLDRLNTLISIAQKESGNDDKRIKLTDLKKKLLTSS